MNGNVCGEIKLVVVFMPSLLTRFAQAEKESRVPLTLSQAQQIRSNAVAVLVSGEVALKLEQRRRFRDLDPDDFWTDWQRLRESPMAPDVAP